MKKENSILNFNRHIILTIFSWFIFASGIYVFASLFLSSPLFLFAFFFGETKEIPGLIAVTLVFVILAIGWIIASFGIRKMRIWSIYLLVVLELVEVILYVYQFEISFDLLFLTIRVLGAIYILRFFLNNTNFLKVKG